MTQSDQAIIEEPRDQFPELKPTNNTHCLNCGQRLQGGFCHRCGQEDVDINLSFMDLVRDFLGDMFTYDSRFYRTMVPLVFRPGFLTVQFLEGKRVPYVPPLRLFLFISFLLFLWFAVVDTGLVNVGNPDTAPEDISIEFGGIGGDNSAFQQRVERIAENPDPYLNVAASRLPYLMFLLLPVFAVLIWLHYSLSGYGYLKHFIFTLHFQSFAYVLLFLVSLANLAYDADYELFWLVIMSIYLGFALRRVYGSSIFGCIAKTASIMAGYLLIMSAGIVAFLLINIATMD